MARNEGFLSPNMQMPIGKPRPETQAAELSYWTSVGLKEWDLNLRYYKQIFPFDRLNYRHLKVLDVGSGPISVFERLAPPDAQIIPYDTLAEEYNRIAPDKKFPICGRIPSWEFTLITAFNCLDHMDDPDELLAELSNRLESDGELWVYCHIDRPFSPDEHPQDFSFWRIINLVHAHFDTKACGLIREGRLFPYAWWGICGSQSAGLGQASRWFPTALAITECGMVYSRFHAERAAIKFVKLVGLRKLLPPELQF